MPEPALAMLSLQILQGLEYLHRTQHQIHRDIKPSNFLVTAEGRVKMADFGIAADLLSTAAAAATFVGTVVYMSPERIRGERYSYPADVWSFGLLVIEAATGVYPFFGVSGQWDLMMRVINGDVPALDGRFSDELRHFVGLCMQKAPEDRATVDQLLHHPFITKIEEDPLALAHYVRESMAIPYRKGEIAAGSRYLHALFDMLKGGNKSAPFLFASNALATICGEKMQGGQAIAQRLVETAYFRGGAECLRYFTCDGLDNGVTMVFGEYAVQLAEAKASTGEVVSFCLRLEPMCEDMLSSAPPEVKGVGVIATNLILRHLCGQQ
mmetsp:Transcript_36955/g.95830  ORF Transcript_36955/g.95830 Transcript_36955/m.95830 type:complete len:324 (-) Transcript_36955:92-1063(-)